METDIFCSGRRWLSKLYKKNNPKEVLAVHDYKRDSLRSSYIGYAAYLTAPITDQSQFFTTYVTNQRYQKN